MDAQIYRQVTLTFAVKVQERQRSRRNLADQAQTLVSSKVYSHGYGLPFLNLDSIMSRLLVGKFEYLSAP